MSIQELLNKYDFHDSLIENVSYDTVQNSVKMKIDFCNWMQDGYSNSSPETSIIYLFFCDVTDFKGPQGDIDDFSILEVTIIDNFITFMILDDFHDVNYEIKISCKTVDMIKE